MVVGGEVVDVVVEVVVEDLVEVVGEDLVDADSSAGPGVVAAAAPLVVAGEPASSSEHAGDTIAATTATASHRRTATSCQATGARSRACGSTTHHRRPWHDVLVP